MYSQAITQQHRTAIIIALDRSSSMQGVIKMCGSMLSKAEAVAFICNYLIDELIERSTRPDGIRNYYDIAIIGYGNNKVESLLRTEGKTMVSNLYLAENKPAIEHYRFEDDDDPTRHFDISLHRWVEPYACCNTPMCMGLNHIAELVEEWCAAKENRESFPPIVFNITDGEFSDGCEHGLLNAAERIKRCSTEDGNVLLINLHLSSEEGAAKIVFPSEEDFMATNREARLLFTMSSRLPETWQPTIREMLHPNAEGNFRAFAYNASAYEILSILNIGSESQISASRV